MKNYLHITASLLLLSFQALAEENVVLVSDIDDTIKVSHVLDIDSVLANTIQVNNSFLGMAELYHSMKADKKANKIVYLSSAPDFAMQKLHEKFLSKSKFPEGTLMLSLKIDNRNHKISALRKLITEQAPSELILIGDNGERDAEIYRQIQTEYPALKMTTFIHQAYSRFGYRGNFGKPLEENQIGYATSIDLAAHLLEQGYLSEASYESLINKIVPLSLKESNYVERGRPMMFPAWLDCRDYVATKLPASETIQSLVTKFEKRIGDRCGREPYRN